MRNYQLSKIYFCIVTGRNPVHPQFFLFSSLVSLCSVSAYTQIKNKPSQHQLQTPAQPVCERHGHQPSHQDEPGGAVVEGVLAIAEDVRALLGAGVWARVVHERLIVDQVRHLALALVRHLRDLRVGGGESRRGCAVSQVLIDATVEDGGADGGGSLGRVARTKDR